MLLHAVPSGGDTYKLRNELPLYGMSVCMIVHYAWCCVFVMFSVFFALWCDKMFMLLWDTPRGIKSSTAHIPVNCVYTVCLLVKAWLDLVS